MPKPENQIDVIEEVESILTRLVPAAMSESATRANDSMIERLADKKNATIGGGVRAQAWWKRGIAASILLGAGFSLLSLTQQAEADNDLEYLGANRLMHQSGEEQVIQESDGPPQVVVGYQEDDALVYLDRQADMEIEVVQSRKGYIVIDYSETK